MLSLTKKTDYALIALCFLAQNPGRVVPASEIAAAFEMPAALLMNILKTLHHSGWLTSTRGTKGGYQLCINLQHRTVHDLIEVLEGPVSLTACMLHPDDKDCTDPSCRINRKCPIQAPIKALHQKLVRFLRDVKLSDILLAGKKTESQRQPASAG